MFYLRKLLSKEKVNDTVPGINEVLGEIDSLWSSRNCNCPIFGSFFWVRNFDGCPWELPVESKIFYINFQFKSNFKRKYSTKSGIVGTGNSRLWVMRLHKWKMLEVYDIFLKKLIQALNFILVYKLSSFSFVRQYFNFNCVDILSFHQLQSFFFSSSFNVTPHSCIILWNEIISFFKFLNHSSVHFQYHK